MATQSGPASRRMAGSSVGVFAGRGGGHGRCCWLCGRRRDGARLLRGGASNEPTSFGRCGRKAVRQSERRELVLSDRTGLAAADSSARTRRPVR